MRELQRSAQGENNVVHVWKWVGKEVVFFAMLEPFTIP